MQRDPILAVRSRSHVPGYRVPLTFKVEGGLHYLTGNSKPHFSLTYTQHRKGFPEQCYSCGADHDEILALYPQFADLAALHLSDIDGVPMSAEADGWYWLAGALGGMGEEYHAGNSKGQHGGEYREPTRDECLQIFADHYCRVPLGEAAVIAGMVERESQRSGGDARAVWRREMETMRPRWKAEAEACIANHRLRVYGDPWPQEATTA